MLTVGHNDPGYLPDAEPVEVKTLDEAIATLMREVEHYFSIEIDAEEMTLAELNRLKQSMWNAKRGSNFYFRGHCFWVQ
jgi:hypothetical protein